jgi:hypothetical protein
MNIITSYAARRETEMLAGFSLDARSLLYILILMLILILLKFTIYVILYLY